MNTRRVRPTRSDRHGRSPGAGPAAPAPPRETTAVHIPHDAPLPPQSSAAQTTAPPRRPVWLYAAAAGVVLTLTAAAVPVARRYSAPKPQTADGTFAINTTP